MTLDIFDSVEIIQTMENYMEATRPSPDIRSELDITYKIEGQSVILYEVRPFYMDNSIIQEIPYAKTTFIRSKKHWKVFWMKSDLKWHSYPPIPTVKSLKRFLEIVDEDKHACFKG